MVAATLKRTLVSILVLIGSGLWVAALLIMVWLGTGFVSAQGAPVRINGAIDKLTRGKSLAGAIIYDFSLYAAAQFASFVTTNNIRVSVLAFASGSPIVLSVNSTGRPLKELTAS